MDTSSLPQSNQKFNESLSYEQELKYTITRLHKLSTVINPTRLGILAILVDHHELKSSEIRDIMDVSWGMFHHGVRVLEEEQLIKNDVKFINSTPCKVLSISKEGLQIFQEIKNLVDSL